MKRPLAYITAAWLGGDSENAEQAARYCRAVYEAGFSPICPPLYLPLFLNDAVPEEHKSGIDMGRDLLRRSHDNDTRKVTTHRFIEMKQRGEKISMLTSYDFTTASIVDGAGIDGIGH